MMQPMAFRPLAGIRVLDLTSSLAGPTATEILGALGADIVKIEHPGRGDEARDWGPRFFEGGSVMFFSANAGKRSLALDLKSPRGARGAAAARRRRGRGGAEPAPRHGRAARLRAGGAPGAQPAARLRDDRRLRAQRAARLRAGLRPADAGGGGDHERHRRARRAPGAGRRLADRHRHRRLGGARDRRGAARGPGADARPLALRDGALARPLPARRRPRGRRARRAARHRVPADRPVPGVRDRRRRADDRGGERPPLREGLPGGRRAGARRATSASPRTRSASPTASS